MNNKTRKTIVMVGTLFCLAVLTIFMVNETLSQTAFTVTNTNDSGPGSLRQAILDANAAPGRDVIRFDIPGIGPHHIQRFSAFPIISDPVIIDGTTQPGFDGKPIIELDGSNAGPTENGLSINAGNSIVQGLVINRFGGRGIWLVVNGGNIIRGNYLGTDVNGAVALGNFKGVRIENSNNNIVGGTTPEARNLVSGNFNIGVNIVGIATGNLVQGNFIGTDATGSARLGNGTGVDVAVGASGNTIGGAEPGARNIISGNATNGIRLDSPGATDNKVMGNYIGTDVTGHAALGNRNGVIIAAARNSIIKGNVISGNSGIGLDIDFSASGNKIIHNLIGTNAKGTKALGNLSDGIDMPGGNNNLIANNVIADNVIGIVLRGGLTTGNLVQGNFIGIDRSRTIPLGNRNEGVKIFASKNTIGGSNRDMGNTIAFNGGGVFVYSGTGNTILANSIFSNSALGIDLGVDGVTLNDAGDSDTGPHNLQNFPVLASASSDDDETIIEGTLNSTPNTSFRLEFFSNPICDPTAHGEGKRFLGSKNVTTNGSGNASFEARFDTDVAPEHFATATATDPGNNTSEFSRCIAVTASSSHPDAVKTEQNKTEVAEEYITMPGDFALFRNHPNPFNPSTVISFQLPVVSQVRLTIYNLTGQLVRTLVNAQKPAGRHQVVWDGLNDFGERLPSGVYLYRIEAGNLRAVGRLVMVK